MKVADALLEPMEADEHKEVGGVIVDVGRAGNARVKRMIYPPGFNWGAHLKPTVGGELSGRLQVAGSVTTLSVSGDVTGTGLLAVGGNLATLGISKGLCGKVP